MHHRLAGNALPFSVVEIMVYLTFDGFLASINRALIHIVCVFICGCVYSANVKKKWVVGLGWIKIVKLSWFAFHATDHPAPSWQPVFGELGSKNCDPLRPSCNPNRAGIARIDDGRLSNFEKCIDLFFFSLWFLPPNESLQLSWQSDFPFRSASIVLYTMSTELKLWNSTPFLP